MKLLKLITFVFIIFGNISYKNIVFAEVKNPKDFKVLSNDTKKLSISNVEFYIKQGDNLIKEGDFVTTGTTTQPMPFEMGDEIIADFGELGEVRCEIKKC